MLEFLLPLAVLASTVFTLVLLMLPSRYVKHSPPKETMNGVANEPKISVQVLVLGDIGRSPRMQYHAMSIAKHGGRVDMIGYQGMQPNSHNLSATDEACRIYLTSWPHRQSPCLNCALTSSSTYSSSEQASFRHRRSIESPLADMEFILHTWIQHESFAMAISPEPSLDSHSLHRNNNLFPPEHAPHHRLA